MKTVGTRRERQRFGFEQMRGFAEMLNEFRGVRIMRPRGIFRFSSFEEAETWWQESTTIQLRRAGRPPSET